MSQPTSPTSASSPRSAALAIVQTLQAQGHVAYFAGGCVRDALLGKTPKDYDVATSALPDQVAALFRNTQFVGEAFGVTLVRLFHHPVEVATFRKEWGYTDGRRPTQIEFTDAQHDALRRDFTINGLFENPLAVNPAETIIDFVQGLADLKTKTLRAIGNPDERFAEDYLRMLRAARFAARLGFNIEEKTVRAITNNARYLGQISRERIGQEIMAMLTPSAVSPRTILHALTLVQSLQLDSPSLNTAHLTAPLPTVTRLTQLLEAGNTSTIAADAIDYPACLLAWLIDRRHAAMMAQSSEKNSYQPFQHWLMHWIARDAREDVARWRRSLILSNAVNDALGGSLALIAQAAAWSDMSVALRKRLLANIHWPRAHALLTAMAHQPWIQAFLNGINADTPALIATGIAPAILITGADLIALGQKPGPSFRRLLDHAYDLQLEGVIGTRDDAMAWLRNHLKA